MRWRPRDRIEIWFDCIVLGRLAVSEQETSSNVWVVDMHTWTNPEAPDVDAGLL